MKIFIEIILPILADIFLVFIVAFFAASETAFLSITRVTLHQMLKKDTNRLLSLILIGINFVTSLASGLAAMIAIKLAGNSGSTYATIIISFVLIVFGEIMPKTVAAAYPVQAASVFASPLIFLEKLLFPIVWLFSKITDFITKILTSFIHEGRELITEDELKSLIAVGANEGTLENSEKRMLYKIFEFTDLNSQQ